MTYPNYEDEVTPLSNGENGFNNIIKKEKELDLEILTAKPIEEVVNEKNILEEESKETEENTLEKKDLVEPIESKDELFNEDLILLEKASHNIKELAEGSIVRGKIVEITDDELLVDVGYKSDGIISIDTDTEKDYKKGDMIDVYIIKIEDDTGIIQISKNKVDTIRAWEKIKDSFNNNKPIVGKIEKKVSGGFIVDVGIPGFLPLSQLSLRRQTKFDKYIGKQYEFKIFRIQENKNNVVLSRRALLEEKTKHLREEFLGNVKVGDIVEGVVKNIMSYGAFIDLKCIDALLHINDISWGKVNNINDFINENDKIKCMILSIDKLEGKIKVGLKQLNKNPWTVIEDNYRVKDIVEGKVVSITKFGIFIEIEPGLDGLVPISEISWGSINYKNIDNYVKKNEKIKCRILKIDKDNQKLLLSIKQISANPWEIFKNRNQTGSSINGTVVDILPAGVVVRINDNIEGFVKKEDISWEKNIKDINDYLTIGENLNFKILSLESNKKNLRLGLKQTQPDPWYSKIQKIQEGGFCKVTVTSITKYGLFARMPNGIEGLIHISQIPKEKTGDLTKYFKSGDSLDVEITKLDYNNHKIGFSITKYIESIEKKELNEYLSHQEKNEVTLGNLINLDNLLNK